MTRTLFILRDSRYFLSHRFSLARMLLNEGQEVRVLCAKADESSWTALETEGLQMVEAPLSLEKGGVLRLFKCFHAVFSHFAQFKPDHVFTITVVSTLIGGYGCYFWRKRHIALIAGLGSIFRTDSFKMKAIRTLAVILYRLALRHPNTQVVFQNASDKEVFIRYGICKASNARLIPGSGVNTDSFSFRPYRMKLASPRRVGLVARMLKDKGVQEFIEASANILSVRKDVEFMLIGGVDPSNPTSMNKQELMDLAKRSGVIWLDHQDNIAALLSTLDIFCLPSYHEGLPKAMLEAAAAGCALIVSDIPGCTDFVENGVTGLTVSRKDASSLESAILQLLNNPDRASQLSIAARERVVSKFADKIILSHYKQLFQTNNDS